MREKESIEISKVPIEAVKALPPSMGSKVLIASRDNSAYILNLSNDLINSSSTLDKAFTAHRKRVTDVEYSSEGDKVITVGEDNQLIIWDRETKEHKSFRAHSRNITSVALNQDKNKIVTASEDATFILWNVHGDKMAVFDKSIENMHREWINACTFIPNSNDLFVTGSEDGTVKIWDLEANVLLKTFIGGNLVNYELAKEKHTSPGDYNTGMAVKAISISKDGSLLAYGGRNSTVYLINHVENETVQTIVMKDKVIALASAENQPIIAISVPNKILLWNIIEECIVSEYVFAESGERYCYSMAFVGDELVAGLGNGKIVRIELARD